MSRNSLAPDLLRSERKDAETQRGRAATKVLIRLIELKELIKQVVSRRRSCPRPSILF